ncbi:ras-related protein Rab-37-like [Corticium candelabrum]|uniref:ras-related protein Rab-37-like n=1 Tax=Corticium candelabrum TaxID=121492 RepID=UPI002E2F44BC|nr:ras-related protein Rab-37-like [Corticium candelabrum]
MNAYRRSSGRVDHTAKVVMAGDCAVGKSCLLYRFVHDEYILPPYIGTVAVDLKVKVVDVDGTRIRLQVWDTAGQERFRSLTRSYFRGALALILVYDITKAETLHIVREYISSVVSDVDENLILLLLGNKSDVSSRERIVSYKEGLNLASKHGIQFLEVSAKTGSNVMEAFNALAKAIKIKLEEGCDDQKVLAQAVQQSVLQKQKKSCCF